MDWYGSARLRAAPFANITIRGEPVAAHRLEQRLRGLARELEERAEVAEVRGGDGRADEGDEDEVELRLGVDVEEGERGVRVAELDGGWERGWVDALGVGAQNGEVGHARGGWEEGMGW